MNKKILLPVIFLLSCQIVLAKSKSDFFNLITSDLDKHSYYIAIDIKDKGLFVIENGEFCRYLFNQTKMEETEYISLVKRHLIDNEPFALQLNPSNEYATFLRVKKIKSIEKNAQKGIKPFLGIYFMDNGCMKENVTDEELAAIIYQLYKWQIPIKSDCESGCYYITKEYFNND